MMWNGKGFIGGETMKTVKRVISVMSALVAILLLGGCLPAVPPSPGVGGPLLPGLALTCLTPLAILFVIALILLLIFYLVRGGSRDSRTAEPAARGIARRRYAAGEINYDELQEILRHLDETEKGGIGKSRHGTDNAANVV